MLYDKDGQLQRTPLIGFRTINILGILAIVKLDYRPDDGMSASVQLALTAEQCRELGRQLLSQADVIEWERPTPPQ